VVAGMSLNVTLYVHCLVFLIIEQTRLLLPHYCVVFKPRFVRTYSFSRPPEFDISLTQRFETKTYEVCALQQNIQ
jgi:hypothetical protein